MVSETAIRDLRQEREIEVAEGQVYGYASDACEDGQYTAEYYDTSFDDVYTVVYCDENAVFLKYTDTYDTMRGTKYRTESRENFEGMVGAGGFKLVEGGDGPRMPDDLTEVRALVKRLREHYETASSRENSTTYQHKADAYDELLDELEELDPVEVESSSDDDDDLADVSEGESAEVDLESVDGIGAMTVERLRDNGFDTESAIRRADRDQIESVSGMGQKNTSNLLATVGDD